MRDYIFNEAAYTACDRSKKNHLFRGYCIITNAGNTRSLRKRCSSNEWDKNNVQPTEKYLFIILIELIFRISFNLRRDKITIFIDRKHLINTLQSNTLKI